MIRIQDFGISADSGSYILGKVAVRSDKKTGEEKDVLTMPQYFSNLQGCLRYIRRQLHYEAIKDYDGPINGAIELLRSVDAEFEAAIAGVEGGA